MSNVTETSCTISTDSSDFKNFGVYNPDTGYVCFIQYQDATTMCALPSMVQKQVNLACKDRFIDNVKSARACAWGSGTDDVVAKCNKLSFT